MARVSGCWAGRGQARQQQQQQQARQAEGAKSNNKIDNNNVSFHSSANENQRYCCLLPLRRLRLVAGLTD